MSNIPADKNMYVAPVAAPPVRRPPATEVGLLGWLRHNLFGGLSDAAATVITLVILAGFSYEFFSWAVLKAQWEVAFLNLKNVGAGPDFPSSEAWRVNAAAYIIVFLSMMAVGVWGRLSRSVFIILAVIAVLIIVIPIVSSGVPEPSILYYVDPANSISEVNFIGQEGEEIKFTIDPLTDESDFEITNLEGYIGNDNQLPDTSWDSINAASTAVSRGNIDPAVYDLSLAAVVLNRDGEVVAQSDYTEGIPEALEFTWTPPESGWYIFSARRDPENPGENGIAWLRVDQLEAYFSTYGETKERIEKYGEPPESVADCRNCLTGVNRTDLRFEGRRSIPQFFSLQLSPYLRFIRQFYLISVIVGLIGYAVGQIGKQQNEKLTTRIHVGLWVLSLPVIYVLIGGISGSDSLPIVETSQWGGLLLTLLLSTISIIAAFPIGVFLALGRQSKLPVVSVLSTTFIEVVRGVPLITLLFMGRLIVPFFAGFLNDVDLTIRSIIVLTLFLSAYLAEVVRGGLQVVPHGQVEAAKAIGLTEFQATVLIVLPQALRAVIPAIMGQFISLYKDTSLVALVGMYEVTGAMRRVLADTATGYSLFPREGWLYVGILYFIFSYIMAEASRRLEETGAGAIRRDTI
ncbi:MAG TPA: amino acid ABC transporter permease [Aggregatilineales bacterium]|nr:amino acid ABC transporter permease [Aggregatilineales bacterium]